MLANSRDGSPTDEKDASRPVSFIKAIRPYSVITMGGGMENSSSASSMVGMGASTPTSASGLSLSVNYLPSKFSSGILNNRRSRLPGEKEVKVDLPKTGGGLAAFKSNEGRMEGSSTGGKLRWTRFKWILCATNALLSVYSLGAIIVILLTWFDVFTRSEVIREGNRTELVLSTLAACLGLLTSVVGWAGILLNNRAFLSVYCLMTWITFIFLVTPGYLTYRKRTYNLEGKINAQWSRDLGAVARLRIQSQLSCCGYYSPFVEATITQTCYSRSVLPGCKLPYMKYQRDILQVFWKAAFSLVPFHIVVMIAALICSNHVTYRFGKGMMPERYRLNVDSMAIIMDQYAGRLAEQYGPHVAQQVLGRSTPDIKR